MQGQSEQAFEEAAESMDAQKLLHFEVPQRDGTHTNIYAVRHIASGKVALLLSDSFKPIEFDMHQGKQIWVKGWGLLYGHNMFAIEDGHTHSLGLYSFRGLQASVAYNSSFNTIEVFYRIRRSALTQVGGNPFLLRPSLPSLAHMPALGPE